MTAFALQNFSEPTSDSIVLGTSPQAAKSDSDASLLRRQVVLRKTGYLKERLRYRLAKPARETDASLHDTETVPADIDTLKVINLPVFKTAPGYYDYTLAAQQEWEGVVDSIDDQNFYASLIDLTHNCVTVTETAEIPLDALSDGDRKRLTSGAIFRWVIGYANLPSGRENTSRFYFRRFSGPAAHESEIPPLCFETYD